MYLQADKPLFSPSFVHIIPPEEPFAEHEAAPEGPIKKMRREKRSLKPPVHLYQLFHHLFSNLLDPLLWCEEVQNAVTA
jgi:hypothetical protein